MVTQNTIQVPTTTLNLVIRTRRIEIINKFSFLDIHIASNGLQVWTLSSNGISNTIHLELQTIPFGILINNRLYDIRLFRK